MLILSVTDIHGNRKACRELYEIYGPGSFDLVVVNGDITDFHGLDVAELILSILSRMGKNTFFVPGNCDTPRLLQTDNLGGAKNIHNKVVELGDIDLYGYGGSTLTPFNTWIEFSDEKISSDLREIDHPFIFVSHNPPYGTSIDKTWMGRHVGSKAIRSYILNNKPILGLHGHIHEARGTDSLGETLIINPGPLRNKYYSIIELDGASIKSFKLTKIGEEK